MTSMNQCLGKRYLFNTVSSFWHLVAMVSVSSSSSSFSDDEPPLEMVLASGSSSSSGEERPADVKHRGMVAMWTWPTPRSYGSTLEVRAKLNVLLPTDWSKEVLCEKFRSTLQKHDLQHNLHLGGVNHLSHSVPPNMIFFQVCTRWWVFLMRLFLA